MVVSKNEQANKYSTGDTMMGKSSTYSWYPSAKGVTLDRELNVDQFGWRGGDLFKLVNINGQCHLLKIDSENTTAAETAENNSRS